jgi:hypothetical protein
MSANQDYIRDYMSEPVIDARSAALVIIDMQYATGSRQGALGRTLKAQGSSVGDYRFARIEGTVLPSILRLRAHFQQLGQPVLHVTLGAALPDASDAPRHMRKLLASCANHVGSREHEILDELKPVAGEHVLRKTTVGAFASTPNITVCDATSACCAMYASRSDTAELHWEISPACASTRAWSAASCEACCCAAAAATAWTCCACRSITPCDV